MILPLYCGPGVTEALIQSVTASGTFPVPGNVIHISEFSVIALLEIEYCAYGHPDGTVQVEALSVTLYSL